MPHHTGRRHWAPMAGRKLTDPGKALQVAVVVIGGLLLVSVLTGTDGEKRLATVADTYRATPRFRIVVRELTGNAFYTEVLEVSARAQETSGSLPGRRSSGRMADIEALPSSSSTKESEIVPSCRIGRPKSGRRAKSIAISGERVSDR